jgi:hypothetical protein
MKILAPLLFVFASLSTSISKAQLNMPADSIKIVLCHKWCFKAAIMGGQRITNLNESITYEFFADSTLKRVASDGKTENGTWTYKTEEKIIYLKIKKITLLIPVLPNDELIIWTGDRNRSGIGTVFRHVENNQH